MLSDDYTMPVIRNVNPDEETSLLYMESIMDEALFGRVSIIIYKAFLLGFIVKSRVS